MFSTGWHDAGYSTCSRKFYIMAHKWRNFHYFRLKRRKNGEYSTKVNEYTGEKKRYKERRNFSGERSGKFVKNIVLKQYNPLITLRGFRLIIFTDEPSARPSRYAWKRESWISRGTKKMPSDHRRRTNSVLIESSNGRCTVVDYCECVYRRRLPR